MKVQSHLDAAAVNIEVQRGVTLGKALNPAWTPTDVQGVAQAAVLLSKQTFPKQNS